MNNTDTSSPNDKPPRFEEALAELNRLLRELEDGTTTLEESLLKYERGVALVRRCHDQLAKAELQIRQLSGVDGQGSAMFEPFEHTASVSPQPTRRKPQRPDDGE